MLSWRPRGSRAGRTSRCAPGWRRSPASGWSSTSAPRLCPRPLPAICKTSDTPRPRAYPAGWRGCRPRTSASPDVLYQPRPWPPPSLHGWPRGKRPPPESERRADGCKKVKRTRPGIPMDEPRRHMEEAAAAKARNTEAELAPKRQPETEDDLFFHALMFFFLFSSSCFSFLS